MTHDPRPATRDPPCAPLPACRVHPGMTTCSTDPSVWGMTRSKSIGGFALTQFSQPPHQHLPWHEHDDASICFVLSGSYTERIGVREQECPPHSLVFKPAFERHVNKFGRLGGNCLLLEITPGRLAAMHDRAPVTTRPGLLRNGTLAALGHRIFREFSGGDAFSAVVLEGLILELLGEASRAADKPPSARPPAWLRRALDLIHDGYAGPLTLSLVAREVGVHPAHLARTFRQHQHLSIGEYIRRLRIQHALSELSDTSASLAEISLHAGFFDQSHFSRVFRQQTGMSPAQFRSASQQCNTGTGPHLPS